MRDLTAPYERAALLPGGPERLFVVLFWRSSSPAASTFRERCADIAWPECFRAAAVDLDHAPDLAAWFDIPAVPVLAVVTDGAVLSMEYECTATACQRLAESGRAQYALMKSMSA